MSQSLCITFRFIQPFPLFHGRLDTDEPEWPPSPMRAFQSLVNAVSLRHRGYALEPELVYALELIETTRPFIVAPHAQPVTVGHRAYVPHNQTDLVTAAWDRGNFDASIASHRIEKDIRPMRIDCGEELPAVCYLYPLDASCDAQLLLATLRPAVRSITALGWGIDQVAADVTLVARSDLASLPGQQWNPSTDGGCPLRAPREGSLIALQNRHQRFLNRLQAGDWTPVPPLVAVDVVRYRRDSDTIPRPHAFFKLLDENEDTVTYPQARLMHIAGMVRHLAIDAMKRNPPRNLRGVQPQTWVESYVAGHRSEQDKLADSPHAQLSYVPLQSIGYIHTDPGVRRVMIVAPIGDDAWLKHLAQQLDGQLLKPLPNTILPPGTYLRRIADGLKDGVRDSYLRPSRTWASVTPVILPGHDDHKPEKTHRLIMKALQQSGIEHPCEFEWSSYSHFPKSLSAHKYDRAKNPTGYIRPDHLLNQSAVHLKLCFAQELAVPGPLTIGAGRHCGFGILASV